MLRITNPAVLRGIALREAQCVLGMQEGDLAIVARDPTEELLTGTLVERSDTMLTVIGEPQSWMLWLPQGRRSRHWDTVRAWVLTADDRECVINEIADRLLARPRASQRQPVPQISPDAYLDVSPPLHGCVDCGVIGIRTVIGHCLWLGDDEIVLEKCPTCNVFTTTEAMAESLATMDNRHGLQIVRGGVVMACSDYERYRIACKADRTPAPVASRLPPAERQFGERLRPLEFDEDD